MELSAEFKRLIRRYECGGALLNRSLRSVPEALLDVALAPGKWSVRQITVHVCDTEFVMGYRIRLMIAQPGSLVSSFDQDRWVDSLRSNRIPITTALRAFAAMRRFSAAVLRQAPLRVWENTVRHDTRGDISLRWYVEHAAEHVEKHVRQIELIAGEQVVHGSPAAGQG